MLNRYHLIIKKRKRNFMVNLSCLNLFFSFSIVFFMGNYFFKHIYIQYIVYAHPFTYTTYSIINIYNITLILFFLWVYIHLLFYWDKAQENDNFFFFKYSLFLIYRNFFSQFFFNYFSLTIFHYFPLYFL